MTCKFFRVVAWCSIKVELWQTDHAMGHSPQEHSLYPMLCWRQTRSLVKSRRLILDSFFFLDDWGCMLNTYLVEKSNLIFFLTQMTGETRDNNTNQSSWADKQFIFELWIKTRPPIMIFQTRVFLTSSSKNQFSPPAGEINILLSLKIVQGKVADAT